MATIPCHCLIYQYNLYRLCVTSIQVSDMPVLENECWFEKNIKQEKEIRCFCMTGPIIYELKFPLGIYFFWHEAEERKTDKFPFQLKYEVLMVVNMKSLFWNAMLHCLLDRYWCCRGNYYLLLQSRWICQTAYCPHWRRPPSHSFKSFNKLKNLPDMTWNKNISYRQNSWQHMSFAHYSTLHHCTCTFFQWRYWKYQHELFLGFNLALLQQLWDYLVFPWEIWIIWKSF